MFPRGQCPDRDWCCEIVPSLPLGHYLHSISPYQGIVPSGTCTISIMSCDRWSLRSRLSTAHVLLLLFRVIDDMFRFYLRCSASFLFSILLSQRISILCIFISWLNNLNLRQFHFFIPWCWRGGGGGFTMALVILFLFIFYSPPMMEKYTNIQRFT